MKKKGDDGVLKRSALVLMLFCAALVSVGLVLLFFSFFAVYKVYVVDMFIEVADNAAFNIDDDSLHFGKGVPGNSNSRIIVLSHDYHKPLLVQFKSEGNISGFVGLPDDFYLEPGLGKEVAISADVPEDAVFGKYSGRLTVYFRRV